MRAARVVVIGSSNTDMVVKLGHLPAPGETVLGGAFVTAGGGKGANQAIAARRLGAEVTLIARVGADAFGASALSAFAADGVDTANVTVDPESPSGVALIFVDDAGENMIAVAPGANRRLAETDVERAAPAIKHAHVVVAQLEVPLATVEAGMRLARAAGAITLLNPAPAPELDSPGRLLAHVDIVNPNRTELGRLTHAKISTIAEASAAARGLLARGVRGVVVTLGADGALVVDASGVEHVPAYRVRTVDATGAGDAFTAGLAVALAEGADLRTAARYANAAAALTTTRLGAQPSMPVRADVDRLAAMA